MCRIAGLIRFDSEIDDVMEQKIIAMRDSMIHGGPDDAGLYLSPDRRVALANRRLSIIELSDLGHQPMTDREEIIWLTYNGEIYNFKELRSELVSRGHTFRSQSDTEVIIQAYKEWGEDSFRRLSGMFAFCLHDSARSLAYLVRDHAGIKPLYYSVNGKRLVFSSEVRAFKVFAGEWPECPDWKVYFLAFGHIPEPFSTLKDVFMLPPGSYLRIDRVGKESHIAHYENLGFGDNIYEDHEILQKTRELFTAAVYRHLISDAPIGVFLSGGIDSSLITMVAAHYQGTSLNTLSVVFNEKDFNEKPYQARVIEKIPTCHHEFMVTRDDFIESIPDFINSVDQPTTDGFNTYLIAKYAKQAGLKAVLSGLGGDELFGGYESFKRMKHIWFLRNLSKSTRNIFRLTHFLKHEKAKRLSYLALKRPLSHYLLFRAFFCIKDIEKITGIAESSIIEKLNTIPVNGTVPDSPGNYMSFLDTTLYMKNQLLKDSDCMGMRHSLELRVPFLDKDLMKYIFSVSGKTKFRDRIPKYLLSEAFKDLLPREIIFRKKMGFTFPFELWMRKDIDRLLKVFTCHETASQFLEQFRDGVLHWSRMWALLIMNQYQQIPVSL